MSDVPVQAPDLDPAARLRAAVAAELAAPVSPAVRAFAAELAARSGGKAPAVLFYGSALRTGETDGLLDFYVLLDTLSDWDAGALARAGNAVLPPNVEYSESRQDHAGLGAITLRAKVAIMTLEQFRRHARAKSFDTTIWTRFTQPAALAHVRDAQAAEAVAEAVAVAVGAASWWAAHLGPDAGPAADFWGDLFRRTYASELRVESAARPGTIVERAVERFDAMLELGWAAEGIAFLPDANGALAPDISRGEKKSAARAWAWRSRLAKPLNLARLAKAVFTFSGGVDYAAWKIERHSGHKIEITPFQRRHPLLSAGPVLWKLWRAGVLR